MSSSRKVESEKPGIPAWMVSFGDMMMLMLTFFIMLCAMAERQEAGMMAKGLGSFITRIQSLGLPGFMPDRGALQRNVNALERKFKQAMRAAAKGQDEEGGKNKPEDHRTAGDHQREPVVKNLFQAAAVFAQDSAELTPASRKNLANSADILRIRLDDRVRIIAHVRLDARGTLPREALSLAKARAAGVKSFLSHQSLDPRRLIISIYPLNPEEADSSARENSVSLRLEPMKR